MGCKFWVLSFECWVGRIDMLFCRLANANEWFDEFERRGSRRLPIIKGFQAALWKNGIWGVSFPA